MTHTHTQTLWWKHSHQWSPVLCLCHNPHKTSLKYQHPPSQHQWKCRVSSVPSSLADQPSNVHILSAVSGLQPMDSPSFALSLHLCWGLYGAVLFWYIKTAAPWSNKQIPPGSAKGYPTSANNAAFKHQSYAKCLVHRGGDGQQELRLMAWTGEIMSREHTGEHQQLFTLMCQLLRSSVMNMWDIKLRRHHNIVLDRLMVELVFSLIKNWFNVLMYAFYNH